MNHDRGRQRDGTVRGIGVALVALALGACVSMQQLAPPVDAEMAALGNELGHGSESLQRGRAVYLSRCVACHSLEPILRYPVADWQGIIPDMAEEAKLEPQQTQDLRHYVLTSHRLLSRSHGGQPKQSEPDAPRR